MSDSSDDQLDPLFLELGKAIYICQAFESSLCFLLALLTDQRVPSDGEAFSASWDFHSKETLGRMLKHLRGEIDLAAEIDAYLEEGIDKRNTIVHGFLSRNAMRLADPKGCLEVERELQDLKQEVRHCHVVVKKIIDGVLSKYGLSSDLLKEHANRYWDWVNFQANGRTSSGKH